MYTDNWLTYNCYSKEKTFVVLPQNVKCPKAPKKLGKKRRCNNSTIPPLDFRLCPKPPV